jgi:hypothetical protein
MARGEGSKKGDAVKSYTLVMTLLVIVMGVLYFVIDGTRKDYEEANVQLEKYMTGKGLPVTMDDRPRTFPDLASKVEQLSHTYGEAAGGGGVDKGIPASMMVAVASNAGLRQVYASGERTDKSSNYVTISQKFEYAGNTSEFPEIWRLLTLLYNIESRGRYRVTEVRWQAADIADDAQAPFDKIKKPNVEVSIRGPIRANP